LRNAPSGHHRSSDTEGGSGVPSTRSEDEQKRLDRELIELLNELRVALPGVQVLFAFMLIVPFSQGFASLNSVEKWIYFAAFITSALAAALLIAPSSFHRLRFRQGDKEKMVNLGNRLLVGGLVLVAIAISLSVGLISEFVFGTAMALVAGVGVGAAFAWFWFGLPLSRRMQD
jgi:amino acid transporter